MNQINHLLLKSRTINVRTTLKSFAFLSLCSLSSLCSASTMEVSFARELLHPPPKSDPASALPIRLDEIALALRWTGEMNRRLYMASQNQPELQRIREEDENNIPKSLDAMRGGQASVYRIATSSARTNTPTRDTLTVFHAKRPNSEGASGARRWGPDLSKYLHTLVALLSFRGSEVSTTELTLAMIFMDRACSVETPRSDGHVPCPYCTPRTVHRLIVAALLVAVESVRGAEFSERLQLQVSETFHIPRQELEQMVSWLLGALGDQGTCVGSEQFDDFACTWKSRFSAILPIATERAVFDPIVSKQRDLCSTPEEIPAVSRRSSKVASVFA